MMRLRHRGGNSRAACRSASHSFGYTKSIVEAGQFKGGERLRPVASASTVRVRDGKTVVTDGPFAETREQLGGFHLVEARNLDEALSLAARIPSARLGSIEVRPIWPLGEY